MRWFEEMPNAQTAMMAIGLGGLALAQINQPFPHIAPLHHVPTLLFLLAMPWIARRWQVSDKAMLCLVLFLALHTIGGRYTYTNTPYDAWVSSVFGQGLNDLMGWERNQYDRLVHFAFGLLIVCPVVDVWQKHAQVSRRFAVYIGVEMVLAISALYEVFEWLLSIMLAPDNVEAYNGQQGDIWDAQKDMALAFLGALISAFILLYRRSATPEMDGKGKMQ